MAGVITTSLVVQFGSEDDSQYKLVMEIDSRKDGYNKGKTSFIPGDSPYILVYKSPELALTFDVSTGNMSSRGNEPIEQIEFLTFANEDTQELRVPPAGDVDLKYLAGRTGATVSNTTVRIAEPDVAVYKATYDATAYVFQLTGIPTELQGETSFPVVIVCTGTAA